MTNKQHNVLYTGVTSDLKRRIHQHKEKLTKGFTSRYNINKLVWFEIHPDIRGAIEKEKKIKAGSRKKKLELVNILNPEWKDLYEEII